MTGSRPEALRGMGTASCGQVDYRLARNMVVNEFRKGRLSRLDICDAHPELMRAAANVGETTREDCPVCERDQVRLVSYLFGSGLPSSGRCVTSKREALKYARGGEVTCYVVEVCPECAWNHLARTYSITSARARRSGPT